MNYAIRCAVKYSYRDETVMLVGVKNDVEAIERAREHARAYAQNASAYGYSRVIALEATDDRGRNVREIPFLARNT